MTSRDFHVLFFLFFFLLIIKGLSFVISFLTDVLKIQIKVHLRPLLSRFQDETLVCTFTQNWLVFAQHLYSFVKHLVVQSRIK